MSTIKRTVLAFASMVALAGAFASPAQAAPEGLEPVYKASAVKTPPALLPWGTKPASTKFTTSATPPTATTAERTAVKGKPTGSTGTAKTLTSTCGASPLPACFYYNIGSQLLDTPQDATYSTTIIGKPKMGVSNYHDLMEISIAKEQAQSNIVEIGWTKDRVVNGSCTPSPACKEEPYLFGFWWKNGTPMGYNASAGWTDNASNPINLGAKLTPGDVKKMGIAFSDGAWWLAYDTDWVGYYSETNWTGTTLGGPAVTGGFHTFVYYQTFAELVTQNDTPTSDCSQMGNGVYATSQGGPPTASRWSGTITQLAGVTTNGNLWYHNSANVPSAQWTVSPLAGSTKTAWFGGPGGTGTAGGVCN